MTKESLTFITTKDNVQIAVWKISANKATTFSHKAQNILLTHGTFSNKRVCLGLAGYLAKLGHTCYIMEWRGHGDSSIAKDTFNFETVAFYDIAATFDYLFDQLKLDNLHAITHSGGGICLTMLLTQNQHYINNISSITMLACQAYGAALKPTSYVKIFAIKTITRLMGYVPAKSLKLGTINESYYMMSQWYNWNLNKNFQSSSSKTDFNAKNSKIKKGSDDGSFDYRQQMPNIITPIYAISARGDDVIAPPNGCELFLNDFNNSANVFREFSIANGDLEDYDHSRVILSGNAAKEIWPTIATWIERYAR